VSETEPQVDAGGQEALRWARAVLSAQNLAEAVGAAELIKHRPWSTVWRIATSQGPVWLKACPPRTRQEVRLLDALARWEVPHVLTPLAVDLDRGWVLLPDGGPTVREVPLPAVAAAQRWSEVLAGYAQTQRATEEHVDQLVALGVPDLRLPALAEAFEELAGRWAPDVLSVLPRVVEEVAELTELGPPATLQHDDLHDGNVFAAGARPFDWGDACVGHPFASLLVALEGQGDAPGATPVLEAYLACWSHLSGREARRAVDLGVRLGRITRAHSWERALAAWSDPPLQYRDAPAWWLRSMAE
jgi:hypothetical protein